MRTRTTLALLAAAAGLFAFIQLHEKEHRAGARANDDHLLDFDRSDLTGLVITSNEDRVELRCIGNRWDMVAPVQDRADQNTIAEILTQCEMLRKNEVLDGKSLEPKKLDDFGVLNANLRLKLLGKNMPPELLFGKQTAVEGQSYLRLDGATTVYVTDDELRALLARKADNLRDRRLTEFDAAHTTRFSVTTPGGEIELAKKGGDWELHKPLQARADTGKTASLVNAVLGVRIVSFVSDKAAGLDSCGFAEPRAKVSFSTLTEDKPVVLELGAHDAKTGNTYGRLSTRDGVYLLPAGIEKLIDLKPDDLRDRRLMRLDMDIVDRIAIDNAGQHKVALQRKQEDWVQIDGTAAHRANSARVQSFIRALQDCEVTAFVTDVASDLAKYGLDQPRVRLTFSSYSSQNTAETSAGEHPFLSVDFGNTDGKSVYARSGDEPFIVSVNKAFVDAIAAGPDQWRPLQVFQFKADEIVSLEIAFTGGPANAKARQGMQLVRSGTTWKPAPGTPAEAVNDVQIQSLVNTLAKLQAVRWNPGDGSVNPAEGTQPASAEAQTIAFKTTAGTSHKLILGPRTPEGTCKAILAGDSSSFVISAPDESALRLARAKR